MATYLKNTESEQACVEEFYRHLEAIGWTKTTGSDRKFTQEEMQAAFNKVANKENWKFYIDAKVDANELCVTIEAIAWFTGSETYFKLTGGRTFTVRAPGYYVRIGA